jgi:hypothetical protein
MMATVNRSKSDDFNLTLGSLASLLVATLYKKKVLIGTTNSGISHQLIGIYTPKASAAGM